MDYKATKYDDLVWTPLKHIVGFWWFGFFFNCKVILEKNTNEKLNLCNSCAKKG